MKKHYPSEEDWDTIRIRMTHKQTVETYVAKHQTALNKHGVYSIPNFLAFVLKEYMRKHK